MTTAITPSKITFDTKTPCPAGRYLVSYIDVYEGCVSNVAVELHKDGTFTSLRTAFAAHMVEATSHFRYAEDRMDLAEAKSLEVVFIYRTTTLGRAKSRA